MSEEQAYVASVPAAAWPFRLPVIRHIRWLVATHRVNRHYEMWARVSLPVNAHLDYAVCDAIWRGEK